MVELRSTEKKSHAGTNLLVVSRGYRHFSFSVVSLYSLHSHIKYSCIHLPTVAHRQTSSPVPVTSNQFEKEEEELTKRSSSLPRRQMSWEIAWSMLPRYPVESAWQAEAWKLLMRQKSFTETHSWSLAFSLTHTLIFHSRVSLVYGSTCSLLVLSYYKCLLRLNSDIAKAFASVPMS